MHWHALHWIFVASDWNLDPKSVTCDFEKGLINAVQHKFHESEINGCLFHWKQALRKKMITLQTYEQHVHLAMEENVMDMLTMIPIEDIESKGTPCVKFVTQEKIKKSKNQKKDTKNKNGLFFGNI